MNIEEAYNKWSGDYDSVFNKTRDLEKIAAKTILSKIDFNNVIEIGCGTGKNTKWIAKRAKSVTAVDFSDKMLQKAKEKIKKENVTFVQADLTKKWDFKEGESDLISCSLTLEHIENLNFIFSQANEALKPKGKFYICELHPFKQYSGSKAKFELNDQTLELQCFTHHITEYISVAKKNGFRLKKINEWFDTGRKNEIPRLISFVFEKEK